MQFRKNIYVMKGFEVMGVFMPKWSKNCRKGYFYRDHAFSQNASQFLLMRFRELKIKRNKI